MEWAQDLICKWGCHVVRIRSWRWVVLLVLPIGSLIFSGFITWCGSCGILSLVDRVQDHWSLYRHVTIRYFPSGWSQYQRLITYPGYILYVWRKGVYTYALCTHVCIGVGLGRGKWEKVTTVPLRVSEIKEASCRCTHLIVVKKDMCYKWYCFNMTIISELKI